jgi:hypothetical protein
MNIPTDKKTLALWLTLCSIWEDDRDYLDAAKKLDAQEVSRLGKKHSFNFGRGNKEKPGDRDRLIRMADLIHEGKSKRAAAKAALAKGERISIESSIRRLEKKFSKGAWAYIESAAGRRALQYADQIDFVDISPTKISNLRHAFVAEAFKRYRKKYELKEPY